MKYNPKDLERIARTLTLEIEDEIAKAGIFYRIYFRCKTSKSLNKKLDTKTEDGLMKYDGGIKFLRDIIGIRVNLYFTDDLDIVANFIKEKYKELFVEETIDQNEATVFKPTRVNIIYKLPSEYQAEFKEVVSDLRIDSTFELQFRTIISEGWHEVEHDLRYKCPNDWNLYPELARTYNGILAALETHEWSMIQLFDRLSFSHYKSVDFNAMIRTKLRIRFSDFSLSETINDIFKNEEGLQKEFYKLERSSIVKLLLINRIQFPPTLENIIYLINYFFIKSTLITNVTPKELIDYFKTYKKP